MNLLELLIENKKDIVYGGFKDFLFFLVLINFNKKRFVDEFYNDVECGYG